MPVKPSIQDLIRSALIERSVVLKHPVLTHIGPMALLADSQLLFGGEKREQLSQWVVGQMAARFTEQLPRRPDVSQNAVYIGAANGNAIDSQVSDIG